MFASINGFPRLSIGNGASAPLRSGLAGFATHFYLTESSTPDSYILTIDNAMMCSLIDTERRVPVRDMCQRFVDALCASDPALLLRTPEMG